MKLRQYIKKNRFNLFVIVFNAVIISGLVGFFVYYTVLWQNRMQEQAIDEISHLNSSSAIIAENYFVNQDQTVEDYTQYMEKSNFTVSEAIAFLQEVSVNRTFELIDTEFVGYYIASDPTGIVPISYANRSYEDLHKIFAYANVDTTEEKLTPEFTDQFSALKSFANYRYLQLYDEEGQKQTYTLMMVTQSDDFQKAVLMNGGNTEMTMFIIQENGNYIVRNYEQKTSNMYEYFGIYNDLNLDMRNEIRDQVNKKKQGNLFFKNSKEQECVYSYIQMSERNWYMVSCAPMESIESPRAELSFSVQITIAMSVLMIFDLLVMARLNRRIKDAMAQAVAASNAKSEFLSRMSHDIRTPLNGIIGMTKLSLDEDEPKKITENLKNIEYSSNYLLGLVNDVLDMSKIESGRVEIHLEPYRYVEFKEYMKVMIQPLCNAKHLQFILPEDVGIGACMLDKLRLNQIFVNLLSNAVKFTPEHGTIEFRCMVEKIDEEYVYLNFEVRDSGEGMSTEFQDHMFEAFSQEYRTNTGSQNGTGLGLTIVSRLVKLMDGDIRVESKENEGTIFYIRLKSQLADDETNNNEELEYDEGFLAQKRILLCEDHPLNAKIATALLEKKGILVEWAENGLIGYQMFENHGAWYYDAILMDIQMPVMDGMRTTTMIRSFDREDAKRVPIIAMTANAYREDYEKSIAAGMNDHIAKPFEPKMLYTKLCKWMKRAIRVKTEIR